MADLATLKTRLSEAESALHELELGRLEVSASFDDKAVTFTRAEIPKLESYIRNLEMQIARAEGTSKPRRMNLAFTD